MKPVARDSMVVRYVTKKLPIVHDTVHPICIDSAGVNIPIIQKQYCDSTYTAWVSGYDVRLDSIRVYTRREVVTISRTIKGGGKGGYKRLGVNIGLGVGITPKGVQPYVGVGIGYRLF